MTGSNTLQNEIASSYLSGGSMAYVDGLYEDYLLDPSSVSEDWQKVFQALPSVENHSNEVSHKAIREYFLKNADRKQMQVAPLDDKQAHIARLINSYRSNGHKDAKLDPLDMSSRISVPSLELAYHKLGEEDLNRTFSLDGAFDKQQMTLAELYQTLRETYCGSIGIEYMHIADTEETDWLRDRMESGRGKASFTSKEKLAFLKQLIAADGLEVYLGTRFVGQKRFSLEGGDSLILMAKEIIRRGGADEVKEIVIGMAHRGRLNVLINVLGKAPDELFQEFEGKVDTSRTGDVKYHLGFSSNLKTEEGSIVHAVLAFNPSHLEIISPVVEGSARSRLRRRHDLEQKNSVLPVIIHGDAAFAGQGVVMETFNFSQARGYCTGGTIHIVVNNQIGFTTSNPLDARSTLYCTDVAKMVQAPILHVNGDDPEAVVFATQIAFDFRKKFKRDIVLDLVCYRRHGHNEADEPAVTQPLMYQKIKTMRPLRETYAKQLVGNGLISQKEVDSWVEEYRNKLDQGTPVVDIISGPYEGSTAVDWSPYFHAKWTDPADTTIDKATLEKLSQKLLHLPEGFEVHPVVKRLLQEREKMTTGEIPINWGYAETMAYANLLDKGHGIRLSGQDSGRGTFAHRHAVLYDTKTGTPFTPLSKLSEDDSNTFTVIDSVLSEEAVLAFEYGYASSEPTSLVMWEAQFGDFANGAQVVIDQFISSGEQKWGRLCGLVMLLPHGYEGQGPEHSSARLERYLQLCAQQNMQVCVPTTPAQIFHLLCRQILRPFRKPLIVMTPKSLLRHKLAVSTLDELTHGEFHPIIPEHELLDLQKITRVILCSGRVYYDLLQKRQEDKLEHVAILRVEQLYPFPKDLMIAELQKYAHVEHVIWCQEEPQNQGAWFASHHHLHGCLQAGQVITYAGRNFAAAPAGGTTKVHVQEQAELVKRALLGE